MGLPDNHNREETDVRPLGPLQMLEAILFAAGDPVPLMRIAEVLGLEFFEAEKLGQELADFYNGENRGIEVRRIGDSLSLSTRGEAKEILEKFFAKPLQPVQLSQAAYETLAVIAYNEPCTRAQIESVRGVNSDASVNRLIEKGLVEMSGTLELPGRPAVFKTTDLFLRLHGIQDLSALEPMDTLMYDSVQEFEQSYYQTQEAAKRTAVDSGSFGVGIE